MSGERRHPNRCAICGEHIRSDMAEMYDPKTDAPSVICHPDCGIARGLEVA